MVDAEDLKSSDRKIVRVQVPSRAPRWGDSVKLVGVVLRVRLQLILQGYSAFVLFFWFVSRFFKIEIASVL